MEFALDEMSQHTEGAERSLPFVRVQQVSRHPLKESAYRARRRREECQDVLGPSFVRRFHDSAG